MWWLCGVVAMGPLGLCVSGPVRRTCQLTISQRPGFPEQTTQLDDQEGLGEVKATTRWIDANGQSATADELEEKLSDLQAIVTPITLKLYADGAGPQSHGPGEEDEKLMEDDRMTNYRGYYDLGLSICGGPVRFMIKIEIVATRSYNICRLLISNTHGHCGTGTRPCAARTTSSHGICCDTAVPLAALGQTPLLNGVGARRERQFVDSNLKDILVSTSAHTKGVAPYSMSGAELLLAHSDRKGK
ncbi:hypothetical protein JB92DRAFT_3093171 [Gautieria morchelliformis]|nr:hypothetical protein JB92DRAFT_3093171 [Gautieria morchelliformis]